MRPAQGTINQCPCDCIRFHYSRDIEAFASRSGHRFRLPTKLIENGKLNQSACTCGEMAEWLKAHAWKACLGETLTRVRIPVSPPALHAADVNLARKGIPRPPDALLPMRMHVAAWTNVKHQICIPATVPGRHLIELFRFHLVWRIVH